MKDTTKLLKRIISQDTNYVESMRHSLKDYELTIRRLQNKSRSLEKEIEERKQLIKEYRNHLMSTSEAAQTKTELVPSTEQQMDKQSSTTKIELVKV
jgi:predicted RNase H-like nuclease (RuvC/YqgF family)